MKWKQDIASSVTDVHSCNFLYKWNSEKYFVTGLSYQNFIVFWSIDDLYKSEVSIIMKYGKLIPWKSSICTRKYQEKLHQIISITHFNFFIKRASFPTLSIVIPQSDSPIKDQFFRSWILVNSKIPCKSHQLQQLSKRHQLKQLKC